MRYDLTFGRAVPWILKFMGAAAVVLALLLPRAVSAQDRDQDRDRNRDRVTEIEPGTLIPVRTNQPIDVNRSDARVYSGMVDADVRGDNGRLAIPRGSNVELMVRVAPDNDLILDLDSVTVNGERYAIPAHPQRVESRRDNSLVGAIVGTVTGAQIRGPAVRIPRDSVVTFRVERPLQMGVADNGYSRGGVHYHRDYDSDRDRDGDR